MRKKLQPLYALFAVFCAEPSSLNIINEISQGSYTHGGWGILYLFLAAGLWALIRYNEEKAVKLPKVYHFAAGLFAFFMVLGRSYQDLGNWNYLFGGIGQFLLAAAVGTGYYLIFTQIFLFLKYLAQNTGIGRTEDRYPLEIWLFQKVSFIAPFCLFILFGLPMLIFFFPGSMEWDGYYQLHAYLEHVREPVGSVIYHPWDQYQPIFVTWLMGKSFLLGKALFGTDEMGLFFYNFPQFLVEAWILSYGCYVIFKKKIPVIVKWFTLFFTIFFPIWRTWGYTLIKDTYYFLFLYLFLLLLSEIEEKENTRWQRILHFICAAAVAACRNEGKYVILISCITAVFLLAKKNRRHYVICILCCLVYLAGEKVYIEKKDVAEGPAREAFSVPLQQVARYLKEDGSDLNDWEWETLQSLFGISLPELGELYEPELSDPVKGYMAYDLSKEQISDFFKIYFRILFRHPDICVQAFLNQNYGYFYPDRENSRDGIGNYELGLGEERISWQISVKFSENLKGGRDFLKAFDEVFCSIPVVGMLYSPGLYTLILLLCLLRCAEKRDKNMLGRLIPLILTILACLASPVGAHIRYMLPVMVAMPLSVANCFWEKHT